MKRRRSLQGRAEHKQLHRKAINANQQMHRKKHYHSKVEMNRLYSTKLQQRKRVNTKERIADFNRNLHAFNQLSFAKKPRRKRGSAGTEIIQHFLVNEKVHTVYDDYFDISIDSVMD